MMITSTMPFVILRNGFTFRRTSFLNFRICKKDRKNEIKLDYRIQKKLEKHQPFHTIRQSSCQLTDSGNIGSSVHDSGNSHHRMPEWSGTKRGTKKRSEQNETKKKCEEMTFTDSLDSNTQRTTMILGLPWIKMAYLFSRIKG